MYLTDLTFIDEGNHDLVGGMVNFTKCMMISDVLREIQLYQQTKYAPTINPQFKVSGFLLYWQYSNTSCITLPFKATFLLLKFSKNTYKIEIRH